MIESILSAMGKAVSSEFGFGYAVYKEEVKQGAAAPCFFIGCEKSSERSFLGGRYFRENRFCVTFYPADDNGKNSECEAAAQRLLACLEQIFADDGIIRGRKMSYSVKNGVLSFYVNYDMFVYKIDGKTVMGEMKKRVGIR